MREAKASAGRQKAIRVWLEREILDGKLRPGDQLDEQEICRRFGVSRTPLRETLLQLASLDLIEFRPRQGAFIARMSPKQIAAMWEMLTGLEGLCAALAARRMTEEDRSRLRAAHEEARAIVPTGNIEAYDNANRAFHEVIYFGCRNEYLADNVRAIRSRVGVYRRYPFQRAGGLERSFAGHQAILDAICKGDETAADAAMREHVSSAISFLDMLAELSDDMSPVANAGIPKVPKSRAQG
jgi:DNA-binding GntR family transcriptional regulator